MAVVTAPDSQPPALPLMWWTPSQQHEHGLFPAIRWRYDASVGAYVKPDDLPVDAVRLVAAVVRHQAEVFDTAAGFFGWQCSCGVIARCFTDRSSAELSGRCHEADGPASPTSVRTSAPAGPSASQLADMAQTIDDALDHTRNYDGLGDHLQWLEETSRQLRKFAALLAADTPRTNAQEG